MFDGLAGAASGKSALFSCKGTVSSAIVKGEADIIVTEDGFSITSMLDAARIHWADVTSLKYEDYVVYIQTKTSQYTIFKLGFNSEPFYDHLLAAYGAKVRKCLYERGMPIATAKGSISTDGHQIGYVPIEVHDDCILSLPPDLTARRVPLRFMTGFKDENFFLIVTTMDGATTAYSRLGLDHSPVSMGVQVAMKKLWAEQMSYITGFDPTLTGEQASALVKLMPGGMAAPMGAIRSVAPSFAEVLEARIAESRAADTYPFFQMISGPDDVCVGFRVNIWESGGEGEGDGDSDGGGPDGGESGSVSSGDYGETSGGDPATKASYTLLIAAPAPSGNACAVEFAGMAGEAAATFVYQYGGTWDAFRVKLGMALEAIEWRREIIRYTDEELAKPENRDFQMINDRNEALRFVRACFAGRAIHRSLESWKAQVANLLNV